MNVRLKRFEPSMVAAAAIHLALHTRNRSPRGARIFDGTLSHLLNDRT